jgi:hypothetical protein
VAWSKSRGGPGSLEEARALIARKAAAE